jgi:8-oxo-dGTP diphosphatase
MSKVDLKVVCVLLKNKDQILACQRSNTMSHPGKWELPGGKIEVGEQSEEALLREIKEELGIEISIAQALPSYIHQYQHISIELIPFLATSTDLGSLQMKEHQNFKWVKSIDYHLLDWLEADIPILERYFL